MKIIKSRNTVAAFLALLLVTTGAAHAQMSAWQPFVSVTPVYQGTSDLDGGGDFTASRIGVLAGMAGSLGSGNRAGVTLNYDYVDYSFSNPVRFGGVVPWNIVQHYGVSVPLSFALRDDWSLGVTPSLDWFKENGADSAESRVWGGVVSATKRFPDGNILGFGVGVFEQIEKTSAFPLLIVDWRLSDRWRLVNPLSAGPTGPAGLELDYLFDNGWSVGLGAAYRSLRFRLSSRGPVPNGVGEERGLPVFVRGTYNFDKQTALHLYVGVVAAGEMRVYDPSGNKLRDDNFDAAPLLGATLTARF
jgi:hypothetical protein